MIGEDAKYGGAGKPGVGRDVGTPQPQPQPTGTLGQRGVVPGQPTLHDSPNVGPFTKRQTAEEIKAGQVAAQDLHAARAMASWRAKVKADEEFAAGEAAAQAGARAVAAEKLKAGWKKAEDEELAGLEGETGTMEPTPGRDPAFDEALGDKDREYNVWEANAMKLLAEEEGIPPEILEEMISAQQHELEAKGQMEKAAHLAMLNQMGMGQTGGVGYGLGNIEAATNIGQAKIATNIWYDNQLKIQEQRMHKLDLMMDQAKADNNVEAQKELLAMKIAAEKENDLLNLGFNAVDQIYSWVTDGGWTDEQAEAYLTELSKLSKEGDVEGVLALLAEVTGKGADFGSGGEEGEVEAGSGVVTKWPTIRIRVDDPALPYDKQVVEQKVYPPGGHPSYSDEKKKKMYANAGNTDWTNQPPDWPGPSDGTKREWSELTYDEKYKEWAAFAGEPVVAPYD